MEKTVEQLEKELTELKASHKSQWDTYGSELCAGDMIRQEEKLEKEISKLKEIQETELKFAVFDALNPNKMEDFEEPVNGLEQLRAQRDKTVKRWSKLGLLEGLEAGVPENLAQLFEPNPIQKISEDDNSYCTDMKPMRMYTRDEVITIIKRYVFHLSDNGDPEESAKDWFDRYYPEDQIIPAK